MLDLGIHIDTVAELKELPTEYGVELDSFTVSSLLIIGIDSVR